MARLSIENLPSPADAFQIERLQPPPPDRLGRQRATFERSENSADEDRTRVRSLRRNSGQGELFRAASAKRLARKLNRHRRPRSLASSRWMRRMRRRVVGALWKLVREGPWDPAVGTQVATFTLVPRVWEFDAPGLNSADPSAMLAWLRTELNRCGASAADGWLVAFIHGEWEPNKGVYRLHVHGVAAGGMIAVVDGLRCRPHFAAPRRDQPADVVEYRVRLSRQPLNHLPHALSYQLKAYWPERWIGPVGEHGIVKRERCGRRISEPYHSQVLLWLDQWRLSDISLLMKVRVGRQGFVLTNTSRMAHEI